MARYRLNRTITVAGFVAEADPRVTPPSASSLFQVQTDFEGKLTQGHSFFFRALDAGGADVTGVIITFTEWLKDEGSGAFVRLGTSRTTESNATNQADDVGQLYFQVTEIASAGSSVSIQVWVAERANVALLSA